MFGRSEIGNQWGEPEPLSSLAVNPLGIPRSGASLKHELSV
jgi:hypothetical protein